MSFLRVVWRSNTDYEHSIHALRMTRRLGPRWVWVSEGLPDFTAAPANGPKAVGERYVRRPAIDHMPQLAAMCRPCGPPVVDASLGLTCLHLCLESCFWGESPHEGRRLTAPTQGLGRMRLALKSDDVGAKRLVGALPWHAILQEIGAKHTHMATRRHRSQPAE